MVLEVGREEGGKLVSFQYILQRRYLQCHDVVERLWLSVNEKVLTFLYTFCTKYYLLFIKGNLWAFALSNSESPSKENHFLTLVKRPKN